MVSVASIRFRNIGDQSSTVDKRPPMCYMKCAMLKRSSKKQGPEDMNETAYSVFQEAIGEEEFAPQPEKNPAAVALGRLGGKVGGRARAEKLTPKERSRIASLAARKRWDGINRG